MGLKKAGISPVLSIEKSKDAVDTYSNHTGCEHYCGDIQDFNFAKLRKKVDIIYGGPPCQPFSTGGLRKAQNDSRDMIPFFLKAIEEIRPYVFLMENVPGLAVKSRLHYLNNILSSFEALQYKVNWRILHAVDYGVPQKRKRLIVVGCRDSLLFFPKPTHGPDTENEYVESGSLLSKDKPIGTPPASRVKYAKYPDLRKSPYAGHLYNGGGRPVNLQEPCHTILASAGGYKTHWVDTLDIAPKYHKYLMDGGKPKEGYVDGARRLSVEESALLQTFPGDLVFCGSRSSQYTQVGDAVPPKLAYAIGKAVVEQINGTNIDWGNYILDGPIPREMVLPCAAM